MFSPGQLVECIRSDSWRDVVTGLKTAVSKTPVLGGVYRVYDTDVFNNEEYISLEEFPQKIRGQQLKWHGESFRPLKDSALDVFRVHLVGIPVKANEPAHI